HQQPAVHTTTLPYTTLFRSEVAGRDRTQKAATESRRGWCPRREPGRRRPRGRGAPGPARAGCRRPADLREGRRALEVERDNREGDRKSTRLNSSHQITSYAV